MKLATFMREKEDEILQEWEDFARELHSAPQRMSGDALRDHALGMLRFIAGSLESPQSRQEAIRNWRQLSSRNRNETAAEAHGGDRMGWGFSLRDLIAEFRALRASVVRLWGQTGEDMNPAELVRFNEAIDRLLAESLDAFVSEKEHETHLLQSMLSYSSDQSYIFDTRGNILYANRALAESYGRHAREVVGRPVDDLDAAFAAEVHRQIRQVLATGREYRGDFTTSTDNGEVHVIEYLFAPILDGEGRIEAIAGTSRDITARKSWERTLWQHANHDHLTGVPNRRLFLDRLEQDMRLAKRNHDLLALLYIDLDKFKEANDRLGHDGGDLLLKQVAERIASCIRETDTLARMGGDEFTVILVDVGDVEHAQAIARAILARLSRPLRLGGETVRMSASIGIALHPEHGATVEELVGNADEAMYVAKNAGGDGYSLFGPTEPGHRQVASIASFVRRGRGMQ